MRRFIVVGHRAPTNSDFTLDDLAGGAGRLDVLLRCVTAAFVLSHAIRRDTELLLFLQGPPGPARALRFSGEELRYLNPDERSTGALVRHALLQPPGPERRSTPGIYVADLDRRACYARAAQQGPLIYLKEGAPDLRLASIAAEPNFVLGDDQDLTPEEEAELSAFAPTLLSVGPRSLHTDQCITLVHNELDRREAASRLHS